MISIVKVLMTSSFCPTQWDMEADDGQTYYVRYRHGSLTAHCTSGEEWELIADPDTPDDTGSGGEMYTEEMVAYLAPWFDFDTARRSADNGNQI